MKRILIELAVLLGIGGLLWAAIAFLVQRHEAPTLLSVEREKAIGEAYRNMVWSLQGFSQVNDPYIDSVLLYTARRLEESCEDLRYRYHITLVDHGMANAFALPGGYIVVTTGLVALCESAEEFLAVICHEIGHIEKGHIVSRLIKDFGLGLLTSSDPFVMGEIVQTLISSAYNRQQEVEADRFAGALMIKNHLDPRVMAKLLRRLNQQQGDGDDHQELIASHPSPESRVRQILSIPLPQGFRPAPSWIDWDTFQGYARTASR